KIEQRLAPWKIKFLSKGGRLVPIKAVLSSIQMYYMTIFKIPVGKTIIIEKLRCGFLWGDGFTKRKVHLVNWETMCKSKKHIGLGIGHMLDKNKGLLAKWVWQYGCETDSLWEKVLCVKYVMDIRGLRWNCSSKV
ncbi:hypothetical protein Ddye_025461, partial [Dipteronia dyeriana]